MEIIKISGLYLCALLILAFTIGCVTENTPADNTPTNPAFVDIDVTTIPTSAPPVTPDDSLPASTLSITPEETPYYPASIPLEQPESDENITFETKAMAAIEAIKAYRGSDLGIPEDTVLTCQRESYTIGQCVELTYWGDDFEDHPGVPFYWEVNYPQVYMPTSARAAGLDLDEWTKMRSDVNKWNEILHDTVTEMMSLRIGNGYATYDITYADNDYISICFFGKAHQGSGKPGMFVSAVTVDLGTGEALSLSDFIDVSTLTQESLVEDYTVVHKNSQIVEDLRQAFIEQRFSLTDFYANIDGTDTFFLSNDSSNGVFLILHGGTHYLFAGCNL